MSNSVFPATVRGRTFTSLKTPSYNTIVQGAANKTTVRIAQTQNPMWSWMLLYDYLKDNPADIGAGLTYTDLQTLMGFFLARQGQFDDFLYTDPDDHAVTAQALQLVNDGAGNYYSPIQRNMAGQFFEDITDLNPLNGSGLVVKANGVTQTAGTCGSGGTTYELHGPGLAIPGYSFMGMYLKWCAMPTAPITATFNFYFRVRFDMDSQDFEKFMRQLWTIGGSESKQGNGQLKLISARPASV